MYMMGLQYPVNDHFMIISLHAIFPHNIPTLSDFNPKPQKAPWRTGSDLPSWSDTCQVVWLHLHGQRVEFLPTVKQSDWTHHIILTKIQTEPKSATLTHYWLLHLPVVTVINYSVWVVKMHNGFKNFFFWSFGFLSNRKPLMWILLILF